MDTPTIAFAPSRAMSGVPPSSISAASSSAQVLPAQPVGDLAAYGVHRAEDTQTLVTRTVPLPAPDRFPAARAGRAIPEGDRDLHCGVATRIENL